MLLKVFDLQGLLLFWYILTCFQAIENEIRTDTVFLYFIMLFFFVSFDSWVLRDSHELLEIFKVEDDEDDLIEVRDFYPRVVFLPRFCQAKDCEEIAKNIEGPARRGLPRSFGDFSICNRCDISGCFIWFLIMTYFSHCFFPYMIMLAFCKTLMHLVFSLLLQLPLFWTLDSDHVDWKGSSGAAPQGENHGMFSSRDKVGIPWKDTGLKIFLKFFD